ncbi:MAG: Gfo/Idh/MocA family protein [Calditrichia bacterium]
MSTFNWGIIGSGNVVRRKVLPALLECGETVLGAASLHHTSAQALAREFNLQESYRSVSALLKDERIDAVYIATPVSSHYQLTLAAARCGKHVLCEKPMAMSNAEALEMLRFCEQEQVTLAVAYYRRFFPIVQKIKQLLDEQIIGIPLRADVLCYSPRDLKNQDHWRFDPAIGGGGVMMDIGSHRLDLLVYWFGNIVTVSGQIFHQALADVEDGCISSLTFEKNVQANARVFWTEPDYRDSISIEGTDGFIKVENLNSGHLIVVTDAGEKAWSLPVVGHPHSNMIRHFRQQLTLRRACLNSGEQAFQTTKAIDSIYQSNNIKS